MPDLLDMIKDSKEPVMAEVISSEDVSEKRNLKEIELPSDIKSESERKKEIRRILNLLEVGGVSKEDIKDIKISLSIVWKMLREFLDTGKSRRMKTMDIHRIRTERHEVRDKIEELKDKYKIPYKEVVSELKHVLLKKKN